MQDEPLKQKKPADKARRAARTPKQSAQKHQAMAKTPATGHTTPRQLPAVMPLQPRSSTQAKQAASAMQKALAEGDAVLPSGRGAPAGEQPTSSTTAACGHHSFVSPQWHSLRQTRQLLSCTLQMTIIQQARDYYLVWHHGIP